MAGRGGVLNPSRHEHRLCLNQKLPPYKCRGCKGLGAGIGYKCQSCPNFVLHGPCADLPDEYVHTLFPQHPFNFRLKTHLRHECDACGNLIRGFVFQSSTGVRLHPLCMVLPVGFRHSGHQNHRLELVTQEKGNYKCKKCDMQNTKWKYRCARLDCPVRLDVNCAIVDIHRLNKCSITQVYKPSQLKRALVTAVKVGKSVGSAVLGITPTLIAGRGVDNIGGADHGREDIGEEAGRKEPTGPLNGICS
ncbi:hypothetical protein SUGI_0957480 [Cryptomeria japonica]|uniref:protein VACUOLELESS GAMETOPHYTES n=1 Tax=Cryptomeria japonica TaxID=3369 RepID=UPI00241493DD|nr:protein VACUOLELESS GAMETOPHYTES [Cryptomeria japonica]GLJ45469.1 hypothetical protein SUGI_0957480 [Cryptomeria japonica]